MSKPVAVAGTLEECIAKLTAFAAQNGKEIVTAGAQTETERRRRIYLYTEQTDVYTDVLLTVAEDGQVSAELINSETAASSHKEVNKRILTALS